ncbi:MAG: hypothetical protein DRJ64_08430 [Thermoprotei archaeon]|nr:MAG: hypothetical protein DRJ64_08430 [Thermoprotei archaeon]
MPELVGKEEGEFIRLEPTSGTQLSVKIDKEALEKAKKAMGGALSGIIETLKEIRGTPEERAERREKAKETIKHILDTLAAIGSKVAEEQRLKAEAFKTGATAPTFPSFKAPSVEQPTFVTAKGFVESPAFRGDVEAYDIGDIEFIRFGESVIVSFPSGKEIYAIAKVPLQGTEIKKLNEIC